jgi:ABC-2 type transport system permease protein
LVGRSVKFINLGRSEIKAMKQLLKVESLRFLRNPLNRWVLAVFLVLLASSAIWAGLSASEFRQRSVQHQQHWQNSLEKLQNSSSTPEPWADLPALGGLALSVRQFDLLNPEIRILTRSRYNDGRNSDALFNPLLRELGLPDFATVLVLLLPLTLIGLSYGLVQEDRERGSWRLVCAQMAKPWRLVFAALAIRWLAVILLAGFASVLAFGLDSGSDVSSLINWLAILTSFSLAWLALIALMILLPISSAAAGLAMLGIWLITTFAIPAGLSWAANLQQPMPSRLTAIVAGRSIDAEVNKQRDTLLLDWYQQHPNIKVPSDWSTVPRQVMGLPANQIQDQKVRPLQRQFYAVRQTQFEFMQRYGFLSPALSVVLSADQLAGIDAPRYAGFIDLVNQFEDQWREYFVPHLMAGDKLSPADYQAMPSFNPQSLTATANGLSLIKLLTVALLGFGLVVCLRKQLAKP